MLLDTFTVMLLVLILAFGFIVVVFLPSIIETKRPKDRGPRRIRRSSLRESVMQSPEVVSIPKGDQSDSNENSRNLQAMLKEAGVKYRMIGRNTVRILEGITFRAGSEVWDNLVIEGAFNAGARCVFHASIKSKGNAIIGDCVVIKGNMVSTGDVCIGDEVVVGGSVHSEGSVRLGEKVFVGLAVVAMGDVEAYRNSEVKRNILARGVIRMLEAPNVDLPSSLDKID